MPETPDKEAVPQFMDNLAVEGCSVRSIVK